MGVQASGAEKYAQQVRQFLGPYGCQTGLLDYETLLVVAKKAFDVQGTNLVAVAVAVQNLGRTERSARVKEAVRRYWPDPSVLWPAKAPVRKSLARDQL